MPRIRITTIIETASIALRLHYFCSFCGFENKIDQKVTSDIKDVALDGGLFASGNPKVVLQKILNNLNAPNPADRYDLAGFTCGCRKCGKREPWARMRHRILAFIQEKALMGLFVSVFFLVLGLFAVGSFKKILESVVGVLFFAGTVVFAVVYFSCIAYRAYHRKKMKQLISQLPPKSIPEIMIKLPSPPAPEKINTSATPVQRTKPVTTSKPTVAFQAPIKAASISNAAASLEEKLRYALKYSTADGVRRYLTAALAQTTDAYEKSVIENILAEPDNQLREAAERALQSM